MILFSDRGTPDGCRFMNGYGSHTFSMINSKNERVWVKFHFKTMQGNETLTGAQADELKKDPDYAQRDIVEAIGKGEFPKWALKIQVMTETQAKNFKWDPFDVTKVWSHKEYPLIDVGIMELNEIPANYHTDVEQAAFAPTHVVDGMMNIKGNGGENPNYFPNSFDNFEADKNYKEPAFKLDSDIANTYDRNENDDDHFTQPGNLFRKVMTEEQRKNTITNLVGAMNGVTGKKRDEIASKTKFCILDEPFSQVMLN